MPDVESNSRPEIIHAVHGMTPAGTWFLLADVATRQPESDPTEPAFDADWLVVLGRAGRDIITLQGQDA
jgi:hypothetical protein